MRLHNGRALAPKWCLLFLLSVRVCKKKNIRLPLGPGLLLFCMLEGIDSAHRCSGKFRVIPALEICASVWNSWQNCLWLFFPLVHQASQVGEQSSLSNEARSAFWGLKLYAANAAQRAHLPQNWCPDFVRVVSECFDSSCIRGPSSLSRAQHSANTAEIG